MKKRLMVFLLGSIFLGASCVWAEAKVGSAAPPFSVKDASGKVQTLEAQKDKWVVLEWYNKDCPYVRKHYDAKNMQALQEKYRAKGANWLTVISSAKGKQGYLEASQVAGNLDKEKSNPTAVLLDSDGKMGKDYGAKTTPHMFIIDPKGVVVYTGAIDDNDSSEAAVIPKSKNYVAMALDAGMKGQKIVKKTSAAYGCSIKYK